MLLFFCYMPATMAAENIRLYAMRRRKYYCGLAHPRTLSSLYLLSTLNVTHVIKSSRPSPAFHVMGSKVAYNKYARSGSGTGN